MFTKPLVGRNFTKLNPGTFIMEERALPSDFQHCRGSILSQVAGK